MVHFIYKMLIPRTPASVAVTLNQIDRDGLKFVAMSPTVIGNRLAPNQMIPALAFYVACTPEKYFELYQKPYEEKALEIGALKAVQE